MPPIASKTFTALSSLERPLFGQFLRQEVGLPRAWLEDALERQRRKGGRLGQLLLADGLIRPEHIGAVLSRQARWLGTALQGDLGPVSFPLRTFLSLCLPASNDAEYIQDTIDSAKAILPEFVERFEVVVIDDGSWDSTAALVARWAGLDPRIRLVRHLESRGYGAAVRSGLRAARGNLVAFLDAAGEFSLLDLPQLLLAVLDHDVVLGYRGGPTGSLSGLGAARPGIWLRRCLLGVGVRDLDCPYKLFHRGALERLRLTTSSADISAEIIVQCRRIGLRIAEAPVVQYPRCPGTSGGYLSRMARALSELPRLCRFRLASARLEAAPAARAGARVVPNQS